VEPFGLASLEAMASARPVVASRVGGIPEVVRDGVDGILVPPRNSAALAQGLSTLLEDPHLCVAMGTNGRRRAQEVFGVHRHRESLHSVYEQVLSRNALLKNGEVA
jgi:alpha-maltose-1-phosphate synthase